MKHSDSEQKALARAVRLSFRDTGGFMTFDGMTPVFDNSPLVEKGYEGSPVIPGRPVGYGAGRQRGVMTHDGQFRDSTGAFLVGELERLDQTIHNPLAEVSWGRDIDLREDVSIADEVSSFMLSTYGSAGGLGIGNGIGTGKAWIGKVTSEISGVGLDIAKIPNPLTPWALELKYTILELESAAKLGRPIDQQKFEGLQLKHQMDIDEMVYIGDTGLGLTGMVNHVLMTNTGSVVAGVSGSTLWSKKAPTEVLADFNTALTSVWAASAWAVAPSQVRIPPAQFGNLATANISLAGERSVLTYIEENNIFTKNTGRKLDIKPLKWCIGAGAGGTVGTTGTAYDIMYVYTKAKNRIRYPMTLIQRTPVQYDGIYHKASYFCRLGAVELVYPETAGAFAGI